MPALATDRPLAAAGLLCAGMVGISLIDNLIRYFDEALTLWQFQILRAVWALPLLGVAALLLSRHSVRALSPKWVAIRSTVMAISLMFFFAAIPMIPIAQCTAGLFSSPLWVIVLSALWLREPPGWRRIAAVGLGFAGVLLILRPFDDDVSGWVVLPVVAGFLYAIAVLMTRSHCREESPLALLFANFVAFGVLAAIGALAVEWLRPPVEVAPFLFTPWGEPPLWAVLGMAGMAAGTCLTVAMIARAYQMAEASFLTLFDFAHVPGAITFAWLLWDEVPPPSAGLGVALLVAAAAMLAWSARRASAPGNPRTA